MLSFESEWLAYHVSSIPLCMQEQIGSCNPVLVIAYRVGFGCKYIYIYIYIFI